VTYFALRGLCVWGSTAQKERIARRFATVRGWPLAAKAKDTEDRVSRLHALREVGVQGKVLQDAVQDLLRTQHDDGGWGQLDDSKGDAYATATALVALQQAGGMATTDKVYQRGVAWLLKNQRADGTWLVQTRSKPIQKYSESGFPHGKHQFISMAATGWAVTALALTLPEQAVTARGKR
jgi:N-acyl-D-amino-acid deacylase